MSSHRPKWSDPDWTGRRLAKSDDIPESETTRSLAIRLTATVGVRRSLAVFSRGEGGQCRNRQVTIAALSPSRALHSLWQCRGDVVARKSLTPRRVIAKLDVGRVEWLGTSMGALIGMILDCRAGYGDLPACPSGAQGYCFRPLKASETEMSSFVLPYAPSETVGFIPERLERLTDVIDREVEEKKAPGAAMLIARHGQIAYRQCVGDLRPGGPAMTEDAIFRIYSMTKPIVSVAAMMLVEEGRLSITDPVSSYIRPFADVKVGVPNGEKLDLAPLKRPITIQDLMRHTSGLTYGFTGVSPVQKLVKAANIRRIDRTTAEKV